MEASGSVSLGLPTREDPPANATPQEDPALEDDKENSKKPRIKFSENHLTAPNGLMKIYSDFPHKIKFKGKGHEAEYIRDLMYCYKEWAHQMFPGQSYQDIFMRTTSSLGNKRPVRETLNAIRDAERERILRAKLGDAGWEEAAARRRREREEAQERAAAARRRLEGPEIVSAADMIEQRMAQNGSVVDVGDDSSDDETAPPTALGTAPPPSSTAPAAPAAPPAAPAAPAAAAAGGAAEEGEEGERAAAAAAQLRARMEANRLAALERRRRSQQQPQRGGGGGAGEEEERGARGGGLAAPPAEDEMLAALQAAAAAEEAAAAARALAEEEEARAAEYEALAEMEREAEAAAAAAAGAGGAN